MIDQKLLNILCCPETHQPLQLAETAMIEKLNQQISAGTLKNRGGHPLKCKLDGGLVRADQKALYPIVNKLPILLVEESIVL